MSWMVAWRERCNNIQYHETACEAPRQIDAGADSTTMLLIQSRLTVVNDPTKTRREEYVSASI